jgi:hypothetical protein
MNNHRNAALQDFIDTLKSAFLSSAAPDQKVRTFLDTLFSALEQTAWPGTELAARLPVCSHLHAALQLARSASTDVASFSSAFESIAPMLA